MDSLTHRVRYFSCAKSSYVGRRSPRTRSSSSCTRAILSGFLANRYVVHVSTDPVVSCPATSIDNKSSRSCSAVTSSRLANRNRRMEGSSSFM